MPFLLFLHVQNKLKMLLQLQNVLLMPLVVLLKKLVAPLVVPLVVLLKLPAVPLKKLVVLLHVPLVVLLKQLPSKLSLLKH